MSTTQEFNEKLSERAELKRKSLLSDSERAMAVEHALRRDTPVSKIADEYKIINMRSGWMREALVTIGTIIAVVALVLSGSLVCIHLQDSTNQQAKHELQTQANRLNQTLPDNNQVKVERVDNVEGELVATITQGLTRCTLKVNKPDSQHNLYWVAGVDPVDISVADRTLYKCVSTIGFGGLGASGNQ